jgi:hypothetical protein
MKYRVTSIILIIIVVYYFVSIYLPKPLVILDPYQQTQLSAIGQPPPSVTVVTAYYDIPGKHKSTKYKTWFSNFSFLNPQCPLVIFSTGSSLTWIRTLLNRRDPSRVQIIDLPMEQFTLYPYFSHLQYKHQMDPEKDIHSPELYLVWNEKPHFIQRAIQLSTFYPAFNSKYFCWMDCGMIRDARLSTLVKDFMNPYALNYISARLEDRLGFLAIQPSNLNKFRDLDAHQISRINHSPHRIGGTTFIGSQYACQRFAQQHIKYFEIYLQQNRFAGKDQNIFADVVAQARDDYTLFQPMQPKNFMNSFQKDPWMSLLNVYIAGDATARSMHVPKFQGRLGNNLFEVAAVYNIAQSTKGLCVLNESLENNDYVKSIFHRFPMLKINVTRTYQSKDSHKFIPEWFEPSSDACIEYHHYFQHYKYIEPFFDDFRALLELPETQVISCMFLHIRMGDYVGSKNHYVDLTQYYQRCLDQIEPSVRFKVFSDDLKRAEQFIETHLIHSLRGRFELVDMDEQHTLSQMANCLLGGICANSTFSWWGARLNPYPNKRIYYPSQQYPKTSQHRHMDITGLFHPSFTIIQV